MNNILSRIRKVFSESGKSQTEIGNLIGVTPQYVWKILNNDNTRPRKNIINNICQTFGIRYDWLTQGIEPMEETNYESTEKRIKFIMSGENDFAKTLFNEFSKLDKTEWELLEKIIKNLSDNS